MFALITIVAFIIMAVQGNMWASYIVAGVAGVAFAVFEICELMRVRSAVNKEYMDKKRQVSSSKLNNIH